MFQVGDYVPWYTIQYSDGSLFNLQTLGGKYSVLCFFGSTANPFSRQVLDHIERQGERFHPERLAFVGISTDPKDTSLQSGRERGIYLCDANGQLSQAYQVVSPD